MFIFKLSLMFEDLDEAKNAVLLQFTMWAVFWRMSTNTIGTYVIQWEPAVYSQDSQIFCFCNVASRERSVIIE